MVFEHHRGNLLFPYGFSGKKLVCFGCGHGEELLFLLVYFDMFLVLLFKNVVLKTFIPIWLLYSNRLIVAINILSSELTLNILLLLVDVLKVLVQLRLTPLN